MGYWTRKSLKWKGAFFRESLAAGFFNTKRKVYKYIGYKFFTNTRTTQLYTMYCIPRPNTVWKNSISEKANFHRILGKNVKFCISYTMPKPSFFLYRTFFVPVKAGLVSTSSLVTCRAIMILLSPHWLQGTTSCLGSPISSRVFRRLSKAFLKVRYRIEEN